MALKGNGSTGWSALGLGLEAELQPGYTLFCWARLPGGTVDAMLCWGSSTTSFIHTQIGSTDGPNGYVWDDVDNAFADIGVSSVTTLNSKWIPACVSCQSQGHGILYVGGIANAYTLSGSLGAQTLDKVCIGVDEMGGTPLAATASVAECAIWGDALGTSEIASLFAGACPLTVAQDSLLCYFPLASDLRDYGPRSLSLSGVAPTFTDHPPVQNYINVINFDGWALFNVLHNQAIGATQANLGAISRIAGHPSSTSGAQVVASVQPKTATHAQATAAASANTSALAKFRNLSPLLTSASSASSAAISFLHAQGAVIAAKSTQAVLLRRSFGKGASLASAQVIAAVKAISRSTGRSQGQTIALRKSVAAARGVAAASSPALRNLTNKLLSAVSGAAYARSVLSNRVLAVASSQVPFLNRAIPTHISAASPEAAALSAQRFYVRVFSVLSAQVTAVRRGMASAHGAAGAQIAATQRASGRIAAATSAETAFLLRQVNKLPGAFSASVLALVRQTIALRGVASASVQAVTPATNRPRVITGALSAQVAALLPIRARHLVNQATSTNVAAAVILATRTIPETLHVISAQAAAAVKSTSRYLATTTGPSAALLRSMLKQSAAVTASTASILTTALHRVLAPATSVMMVVSRASYGQVKHATIQQVAAAVRMRGSFLGLTTANAAALRLSTSKLIDAVSGQIVGQVTSVSRSMGTASGSSADVIRGFVKSLAATTPATVAGIARYGSNVQGIASGSVASMRLRTNKLIGFASDMVSAVGKAERKIVGSVLSNIATVLRPKSITLGTSQTQQASVVTWYRLYVVPWAYQQTALLPPGGGPAEPPSFGPIDPADQTTFAFDWSARANINDPIASAYVTSVPPGLPFLGPVTISGTLVEVTVPPFVASSLPVTYSLRCTAVFASGRRSSFSIPVPVRTL